MLRISAYTSAVIALLAGIVTALGWWPGLFSAPILPAGIRVVAFYALPVASILGLALGGAHLRKERHPRAVVPIVLAVLALMEFVYFTLSAGG